MSQRLGSRWKRTSTRLTSEKRIAVNLEQPCFLLATGAAKGVAARPDLDFHKSGLFEHPLPARARQAASDSSSPEVDVAHRRLRHRVSVRDIGELQPSSRPQYPKDF